MIETGFRIALLLFCGLATLLAYSKVAKTCGSYFNVVTPWLVLFLIKNIVVELLYAYRIGGEGTDYSFALVTVANTAEAVALLLGYSLTKGFSLPIFRHSAAPYWRESLSLLLLSIILFWPIYSEFGMDVVLSPRIVYMQTRTGYGLNYFLSGFLLKLSFVFAAFSLRTNWMKIGFALILFSVLSTVTGSKGAIFSFLVIIFIYWAKHTEIKVGIKPFFLAIVCGFILLTGAVALLRPSDSVDVEMSDFFDILLVFSDYNRNAQVVIDNDHEPQLGRILIEDYALSKVPRLLYPDKPKNFGSFDLAETYFPEWFRADTGSPSFGAGTSYADFGVFFIPWLLLSGFLQGYVLKSIEADFALNPVPCSFVVLLSFCGFPLLSAGVGSFLLETVALLWLLGKFNRFRLRPLTSGATTCQ